MADNMKLTITADSTQAKGAVESIKTAIGNLEQQALKMMQTVKSAFSFSGVESSKQIVDQFGNAFESVAKKAQAAGASNQGFFKTLSDVAKGTDGAISKLGGSLGTLSGVLKATGVAAFTLAMFDLGKASITYTLAVAKAAEGTVNMADRLGITINQVKQLSAMASIAGVDISTLEGSARILATALEDSSGAGAKAAKGLSNLGVATYDVTGKQREYGSVMLDLLKKLGDIEDGNKRVALATAVLGRGAKELLPLIKNYGELQKTIQELKIGQGSDAPIKLLAALDDEVDKLELAWGKFKKKVAEGLAPIILPIIVQIRKVMSGENQLSKDDRDANAYWDRARQQTAELNDPSLYFARLARERKMIGKDVADQTIRGFESQQAAMPGRAKAFQDAELRTVEGRKAKIESDLAEYLPKANAGVAGAAERVNQIRAQKAALEAEVKAANEAKQAAEEARKKFEETRQKAYTNWQSYIAKMGNGGLGGSSAEVKLLPEPKGISNEYTDKLVKTKIEQSEKALELEQQNEIAILKVKDEALQQQKELQIKQLDEVQGLTVRQQQFVNTKKAEIEQEYLIKRLENLKMVLEAEKTIELAKAGETAEQRAAIEQKYKIANANLEVKTSGEFEKAKADAIAKNAKLASDEYKKHFEKVKDSVGNLFDAMVSRTKSWGDVLKQVLNTFFLAPLKESFSTMMATLMTGGRSGSGSTSGGIGGILGNIFGGGGNRGMTGATPPFVSGTSIPGMVGIGIGGNGQILNNTGSGGGGLSSFFGGGTGIIGTKSAQSMFGSSGMFGKFGGAAQGGLMMGGSMLAMDGWSRGGWTGAAELAGGGAALGMAFGGPVGAAIGAAAGFTIGAFKALFGKSASQKMIDEVKKMYGVTIDSGFAKQLASQAKGQDIRMFLSSPQIRDMIESYAQMTNQRSKMNAVDDRARGVFLTQSGGTVSQAGSYIGNTLYGYTSSLSSAVGMNLYTPQSSSAGGDVVLDKDGTKEFLKGMFVDGIVQNPRAIQEASNNATSQNYGRTSANINLNDPLGGTI